MLLRWQKRSRTLECPAFCNESSIGSTAALGGGGWYLSFASPEPSRWYFILITSNSWFLVTRPATPKRPASCKLNSVSGPAREAWFALPSGLAAPSTIGGGKGWSRGTSEWRRTWQGNRYRFRERGKGSWEPETSVLSPPSCNPDRPQGQLRRRRRPVRPRLTTMCRSATASRIPRKNARTDRNGQYLETDRGLLSITINSDALSSSRDQKPASGFLFVSDN